MAIVQKAVGLTRMQAMYKGQEWYSWYKIGEGFYIYPNSKGGYSVVCKKMTKPKRGMEFVYKVSNKKWDVAELVI